MACIQIPVARRLLQHDGHDTRRLTHRIRDDASPRLQQSARPYNVQQVRQCGSVLFDDDMRNIRTRLWKDTRLVCRPDDSSLHDTYNRLCRSVRLYGNVAPFALLHYGSVPSAHHQRWHHTVSSAHGVQYKLYVCQHVP